MTHVPPAWLLFPLVGAVAAVGLRAQIARPPVRAGTEIPLSAPHGRPDRVHIDATDGATVWARGRSYKACFRPEGVTFVPFFGSAVPRNFEVAFTLSALEAGGASVAFAHDAKPVLQGTRIVMARGPLDESYEPRLDGLEQEFVFTSRPGAGDLTLRVQVSTELELHQGTDGLVFQGAHGSVGYGQAVLVDALGKHTPLPTAASAQGIAITVPKAVLDSAQFPVTVDPLVATFNVTTTALVEHNTDLAFDAASNEFLAVWEEDFSAADHDINSMRLRLDGTPIAGSTAYVDYTTTSWTEPRVANSNSANAFLTVAVKHPSGGNTEIWGCMRLGSANVTGTPFLVSDNSARGMAAPTVGGDPSYGRTLPFLVVWVDTLLVAGNVTGRLVTPAGAVQGPSFLISSGGYGATYTTRPAVSKSCGVDYPYGAGFREQAWAVVWELPFNPFLSSQYRMAGALVRPDSTFLAPPSDWFTHPSQPLLNPTVSSITDPIGNERYLMVAWQLSNVSIYAGVRSLTGPAIPATDVSTLIGAGPGTYEQQPSVDSFGCRFSLAYGYSTATPSQWPYDVTAATLDMRTTPGGMFLGVTEGVTFITNSSHSAPDNLLPRICSVRSGGGHWQTHPPRYGLTWERNGDVRCATYDALARTGGYTVVPAGCGGGFTIYGAGLPFPGSYIAGGLLNFGNDATFTVWGFPSASLIAVCPGCTLGVDPSATFLQSGPSLVQPIPFNGGLVGLTLAVQGIALGSGACPGPGRLSDLLRVQIL